MRCAADVETLMELTFRQARWGPWPDHRVHYLPDAQSYQTAEGWILPSRSTSVSARRHLIGCACSCWHGFTCTCMATCKWIVSCACRIRAMQMLQTSSDLKNPKDTAATSVVVTSLLETTDMARAEPDQIWLRCWRSRLLNRACMARRLLKLAAFTICLRL